MIIKGQVDIVHVHNMPKILVFTAVIATVSGKKSITGYSRYDAGNVCV